MNNLPDKNQIKLGRKKKRDNATTVDDWNAVADKLKAYIDETQIPILKEFCWKIAKIPYDTFYSEIERHPDSLLTQLKKLCLDKKETQLERGGLSGILDKTMVIFSLKQLGWTDRVDTTQHTTVSFSDPEVQKIMNEAGKKLKEKYAE